jgi:hypothetical protein
VSLEVELVELDLELDLEWVELDIELDPELELE